MIYTNEHESKTNRWAELTWWHIVVFLDWYIMGDFELPDSLQDGESLSYGSDTD